MTLSNIGDVVQIEAHGVSALTGRPHRPLAVDQHPGLFDSAMWVPSPSRAEDLHVAFVAELEVAETSSFVIEVQAASNFALWIDGERVVAGPFRFVPAAPEFTSIAVELASGVHRIGLHAHHEGVSHRTTTSLAPFAWCRLLHDGEPVPVEWRCRELHEYRATGVRVSPLLGWVEWRDLRGAAWLTEDFRAGCWVPPVIATDALADLGVPISSSATLPSWASVIPREVGAGRYRDTYTGYELDDLGPQFLLADPSPRPDEDADGSWFTFDLGRVRIGYFECEITVDAPARVTIAYAERLTHDGRPSPVVALSTGPTRMLQVFELPAGTTTILPFQSLGARWLEVRVATSGAVRLSSARYIERDYLGDPSGEFASSDERLDRIWSVGLDTLRANSEDAIVDGIRERGEWLGDVMSAALRIGWSGWGNLDLQRRAMIHAAAGARHDGLVAGCGPGELIYLGTYAAQFMTACVEIAVAEQDLSLLRQLEGPARSNIEAILALVLPDGSTRLPWGFVDWGYANGVRVDAAVLCHVAAAVSSWIRWQELLGAPDHAVKPWATHLDELAGLIQALLDRDPPGYHVTTLAARLGLVDQDEAVAAIIQHFEAGHPINLLAPRLRDPTQTHSSTLTPYFAHYSLDILLENGAGERVRDYWLSAWGWMLDQGATTWWEVFDDRWSQCHAWSGSPTWQMSEFVLGLQPRGDSRGFRSRLRVSTLGLEFARGAVPLSGGGSARVHWRRSGDVVLMELDIDREVTIERAGVLSRLSAGHHEFTLTRLTGDAFA